MNAVLPLAVIRQKNDSGFTIVELLIAITIVGVVMAASVPASVRFYESMQYRQAIRGVMTTLLSARYKAVNSGKTQDVSINPDTNISTIEWAHNATASSVQYCSPCCARA